MSEFLIKLRVAAACTAIMALVYGVTGEEARERHYQSYRRTDTGAFRVDNFRFDRSVLSLEISDAWSGFYLKNDALAQFYHRTERDCSIEVRQIPLKNTPQDEKSAREIYSNEVLKMNPNFVIRGDRPSDQVQVPSSFPYTYSLAASTNTPPVILNTVFVQPPYLYSVRLKVASDLKGTLRTELYSLLRSIRIDPPVTNAPAVKAPTSETNSVTQTNAPSVEAAAGGTNAVLGTVSAGSTNAAPSGTATPNVQTK